MLTKIKTKIKTNTQAKIAVGLVTIGTVALAATLVLAKQGSNLYISISVNTQTINDKTTDSTIGSVVLKAGNKDVVVSSLPITIETYFVDLRNNNLIRNVKLMINDSIESYGYDQLEQIAGSNNLSIINSQKGETVFNFSHSLLIPAGQTRTIFVKADIGDFGGKEDKIKVYINSYSGLVVRYTNKDRAKVNLYNKYDWTKIISQKLVNLLPDLIIESVKIEKIGGFFKSLFKNRKDATIYVKNIGDGEADFSNISFSLAVLRGGKIIASRSSKVASFKIASGEIKSYGLSFNIVSGNNDLTFMVDNKGRMQEKNENNNDYAVRIDENGDVVGKDTIKNEKDLSKYSNKEVFLISDKDWKQMISLIPIVVWTNGDNSISKYPFLIYHQEGDDFDIDSIYHFLEEYKPQKVSYFGDLPSKLIPVLQNSFNLEKRENIIDYWSSFKDVVYVENNYESALLASTYASLLNTPLIIDGYNNSIDLTGKNTICVGNIVAINCNEKYSIEQLQRKYVEKTNTDKIVLVNPADLDGYLISAPIQSEKAQTSFKQMFRNISMSAPYLASSRQELILSNKSTDYKIVDDFLESQIKRMNLATKYLTILASPYAIPHSKKENPETSLYRAEYIKGNSGNYSKNPWYVELDSSVYADLNDDYYQDLNVGRIFSFSVSDASSYVARDLFYDKLPHSNQFSTLTDFDNLFSNYLYSENLFVDNLFSKLGLQKNSIINEQDRIFDWSFFKDKMLISFAGHGSVTGGSSGFDTSTFRKNKIWMPSTIITSHACLTCSFILEDQVPVSDMFCAEMIRRGAISYIGAVFPDANHTQVGLHFLDHLSNMEDLGSAFREASNMYLYSEVYNFSPVSVLLGDPLFNPNFLVKKDENSVKFNQSNIFKDDDGKLIKQVNIFIGSAQTQNLVGIRSNAKEFVDITAIPYLSEDNIYSCGIGYVKKYYDDNKSGYELSNGELQIAFNFENPDSLKIMGIKKAEMKIDKKVIDITNNFRSMANVVVSSNGGKTFIKSVLDVNRDGFKLVDRNTKVTYPISISINFELKK